MRKFLVANILILFFLGFVVSNQAAEDNKSHNAISCPDRCVESRKNCDLSCSQIVGGGAKSRERRECVRDCGAGLGECNERCLNPTPMPTLKPERYHDKSCPNACELKATDCNETCTKYTGGGAKSGKKAICRRDCRENLKNCKNWCANPTPRPTVEPGIYDGVPCGDVCNNKLMSCEETCTKFIGGGAKSGKRTKCNNECRGSFDKCSDLCSE